MASDLDARLVELAQAVRERESFLADPFPILRDIAHLHSNAEEEQLAQLRDILIRALEVRSELGDNTVILDALIAQIGLYPYLDPETLGAAGGIAYESHRPLAETETVFHAKQAEAYRRLMDGENVILSAPTSFGKSLIIDALIASGKYANVVVIVPTIALIDETRRRLSKFRDTHKVITHPSQQLVERNLLVLTQERLLDYSDLEIEVDLFVIDEFYKLSPERDPGRSELLNQALYRLWKRSKQFYFLGPNVRALAGGLPPEFAHVFLYTEDSTVALDIERVAPEEDEMSRLVELCRKLDEPTLIYCRSPKRAHEAAQALCAAGLDLPTDEQVTQAVEWVSEYYHPQWTFVDALRHGVGIHHGRIPRALGHWLVSAFNKHQLRFLICTSTLIEGVNTSAKNVIVFDGELNKSKLDLFTFNNIRGRSGRMFKHFTGRVFLFHDPPEGPLPEIDIPILTQSTEASEGLLLELSPDELTKGSRERLAPILEQELLSTKTLRENAGVSVERQLGLAETLSEDPERWAPLLSWRGIPDYEELKETCAVLWEHFPEGRRDWGVVSAAQLTYWLNRSASQPGALSVIDAEILSKGLDEEGREAQLLRILTFMRNCLSFGFPRYVMVMDSIQREVFSRHGIKPGDYGPYAVSVENSFLPAPLSALDEYGIPLELAYKLIGSLAPDGDLDAVLERLRQLPEDQVELGAFERSVLRDTQRYL